MKRLAILGASGHGKVVADAAESAAAWKDVFFFDDAWPQREQSGAWTVSGDTAILLSSLHQFDGVVVAIGTNSTRLEKLRLLREYGAPIVSVIHRDASVSRYAQIGMGTVVLAGAVINVDTVLGEGCIVNTGASVDHDCVLGNGVHVSPGARLAGGVQVGDESWVGMGALVRQSIVIGRGVTIAAGATVVKAVPDGQTVVGTPARPA